jgi:hypothetical protein
LFTSPTMMPRTPPGALEPGALRGLDSISSGIGLYLI